MSKLRIWTQLSSFMTVSITGVFNHYATTAHEPSWLKSIGKFSFQNVIFFGGSWGWYSQNMQKMSVKYLLISKKEKEN